MPKNEVSFVPDTKAFRLLEVEAVKLAKTVETTYLEMGKILAEIADIFDGCRGKEGLAKERLGYETFEEWVEGKMRYTPRKAYYLTGAWKHLHLTAGVPKREIEAIGLSKARELTPLVAGGKLTKDNAEKWIAVAKTSTTEELKAKVKTTLGKAEKEEALARLWFSLYPAQLANVNAALAMAQEISKSDKPGHLLDTICLEYNASHIRGQVDRDIVIARIGACLETSFGVKVVVVDPSKGVLFGQETVEEAKP